MKNFLRILVQDYGWIHISLGLFGNTMFFIGSVLFLPSFEIYRTLAVWLFIVGSFFMLIGSVGRLLVDLWDRHFFKK
ncbi:YrhK family protein [Hydrogenovibrio sp. 3SP14C1]|uniref:YrhK family protein n=1 Tax=Hydrogenovibrio sp. 3SP14C1 TaxID=3038774 RepID=UPI0024166AA3|nr:YrhK family protein [Hydrogenovibrio sp. 3SP14C1]MDG4812522.1 YrhK family protein [Hydrogenovibrio sp. 3SP14C1]